MKIRYLPILLWLFSTVNYAAQPPVEFQAPIPQFHDMVAGATETETYVLINHVRQPLPLLSISGFSSPLSRNFNVANNCGQTLPALGTCAIQLTANGSQVGTINQSLIVNYGGRSPLVTPISFSVTSPIAFTATPAVSNMLVNSTQSLLYTITNVSSDTVSLSFSGFGSPITRSAGVVNNCGSSLAAGASCNVLLMAAPTTTGNISQSLIANFGSGTISSPISFQVQAVGVDEANSSAAIFGFGGSVSDTDRKKILRGQLVTGTITVKNFSSSDVVANLSASISAPSGVNASIGSTTCGDTLAAGASCTYTVNFQASNATFSAGLAAYPAHFLLNYNETSGTASISYPFELYQFNPGIFAQLPFNIGGSFNSLPSNSIRAITGNADGSRLYAATDRGLAVSLNHGKNWYVVTPSMGLSYPKLGDVFVDGNNLYVASLNGLNISTDGGTSFVKRTTSDGLGSNIVNSVYASGNNVYVGTVNGVSISTDGGQSFTNITSGLADNIVLGIAAASGYVYAATSAGLGVLDPNEGDTFTNITGHGLGSNSINDVFVANNKIYAATQNGLSIAPFNSDPTQLSFVNHNFVNSNNIFSVYVSGNNVYVTTIDSFAISADGGQTFTESPLLVPPIASDIFAYGANIYIATDLDGVYVSPDYGQTLNQYTVSAVIPSDEAYGVYAQGNNLYVGTSNGLAISPDQGSTFALRTTSNGLGDNHVRSVYGNGNNIYVGTLGGVSASSDNGASFTNYTTSQGLGSNVVLKVFFDSNNLYAATLGGLSIAPVNDNNIGSFSNKTQTDNGLGSDSVGGVFAKDNLVYAATFNTNGGMSKSTDGGEHFTHIEFEPAGSNAVFVGNSNQNVYAAAPSTGLEFSGDGGNSYQLLTTANGLGSDEANDVYVQAGQVYVATGAGVSIAPATSTNIPTFTNYPVGVNFSSNGVNGVFALNQAIYAATNHGIFVTYLP